VAWRQAPQHSGAYEDEIALLLVHGILHLLGMDHEEGTEAAMMEALELQLLAAHHREPGAIQ
jgi:probable rRNA maturation factor